MKRWIVFAILFSLGYQPLQAQVVGGKFDKLFNLFALEKYEDCAYKAEKLTLSDKTKKEPEPYLYLAMCMYHIHMNIEDYDKETYKDPLKDALKYAYKFRKKDKDGEYYENNIEFIEQLKKESLANARFFYRDENYRKAASVYTRIAKIDPTDANVLLMKGLSEIKSRNAGQGALTIKEAMTGLQGQKNEGTYTSSVSEPALINGLIDYSDYLKEVTNDNDSAQAVIQLGRELLPSNEDLKQQYDKIFEQ